MLWAIICELSTDEDRRRFARAILEKRIYVGDAKAAAAEFERARAMLLDMREIDVWAVLLVQSRAWAARLLDVHIPGAATMLRNVARRALHDGGSDAAAVDRAFRFELGKVQLAPSRRGPHTDRRLAVLADRVVIAHRWLTGDQAPQGDPYDPERPVSVSSLYRLGEAAFRAHGLPWYASRLRKATQRAATPAV